MSHFNKNRDVMPIPAEKYIPKNKIETESGASIYISKKESRNLAIITGSEKERARAKTLIREFLEKLCILPTIGYTLLEVDNLVDIRKAKFQFIKFEGDVTNINSKNNDLYFVQMIKETKDNSDKQEPDFIDLLSKLAISPHSPASTGCFTTSRELDVCLENIFSQLSKTDPTDHSKREVRLNLFFGRELFSNFEKRNFDVNEWTKFRRMGKKYCTSFQQNAPQLLEKMSLLEKKFKFKEDKGSEVTLKDKGSIAIYFEQKSLRKKIKLHWDDKDRKWKITKYMCKINRVAILDLISGSEAPDCRFLLKTCYDIKVGDDLKKIIDEIQSSPSFRLRDKMWFRVSDFDGKLDKVEIRQTMSKRRFFNESFQISIVSIKQDSNDKLITQQTTSLKNRSWRSVENIDRNFGLHYDEREISRTIGQTIQYARKIVNVLS